jgi:hypothetical protein
MQQVMTTNDVRRKLVALGAVNPGRKAVQLVAQHERDFGGTSYWVVCLPDGVIESAIQACSDLRGQESYREFAAACHKQLLEE